MNCTDSFSSTCQHRAVIDIESVSSYEGSEGKGEYAGGQGKNAPEECLMRIYKHIMYHLIHDSLYQFQISSAIFHVFSFEIADQNLQ